MSEFGNLETGDWFKHEGQLVVKIIPLAGVNAMSVGPYFPLRFADDDLIEPVEVTITIV